MRMKLNEEDCQVAARSALLATANTNQYLRQVLPFPSCFYQKYVNMQNQMAVWHFSFYAFNRVKKAGASISPVADCVVLMIFLDSDANLTTIGVRDIPPLVYTQSLWSHRFQVMGHIYTVFCNLQWKRSIFGTVRAGIEWPPVVVDGQNSVIFNP